MESECDYLVLENYHGNHAEAERDTAHAEAVALSAQLIEGSRPGAPSSEQAQRRTAGDQAADT